jgi:site-specific DNA recombinase
VRPLRCAYVGELKKNKYMYYRCTGYRGKCGEPFVREEVLDQQFREVLANLAIDKEVAEWIGKALRDSHEVECREHEATLAQLLDEYRRLQARLGAAYEDKLDGRITGAMFDAKAAAWRARQDEILRLVSDHQGASRNYVDDGVRLLDLARRAPALFEGRPASEKRQLLGFVLSNSTWAEGKLTVQYRQPFDLLADRVVAHKARPGRSTSASARNHIWGG